MATPKTSPTAGSVSTYLSKAKDPEQRKDAEAILKLMQEATGAEPEIWGSSFIGLGRHEYQGSGGRSTIWPVIGLAIRGDSLTLYLMSGLETHKAKLEALGKYKSGKGCLYIGRLKDVRLPLLRRIIQDTVKIIESGRPPL
jgi:uncharacterized protein DUF1801